MNLIKTKLNGLDFWYKKDDKFVGQRIASQKYEEYETKLMLSQVNKYSVAVDVGANIGYYTLLLAQQVKKVYAIEPDKDCFKILTKNITENNLENVVLINIAASDKKEKKYLVKDRQNQGNSKVNNKKGDVIFCERLEEILINEHNIDLLKIDTQGWEPQVIEGAKNIIKRDRPTIFLEYTPSEYKDGRMIKFLKNIYKNIWSIDYWFYICKKGIKVDNKTGYVDLWLKKKMSLNDYGWIVKEIRVKKVIKAIINYGRKYT